MTRDFEEYREIIINYYESKHFYNRINKNMLGNPVVMHKLHGSKETSLFLEFLSDDEQTMYFEFLNDVIEYRTKKAKEEEDAKLEKERRTLQTRSTARTDEAKRLEIDRLQEAVERLLSETSTQGYLARSDTEINTPTHSSTTFNERQQQQQSGQSATGRIGQTLATIPEEMMEESFRRRAPELTMQTPNVHILESNMSTGHWSHQQELNRVQQVVSTPLYPDEMQQLQQIEEQNFENEEIPVTLPEIMDTSDAIVNEFRYIVASCQRKHGLINEDLIPSPRPVVKKKPREKFYFHNIEEHELEEVRDWSEYGYKN